MRRISDWVSASSRAWSVKMCSRMRSSSRTVGRWYPRRPPASRHDESLAQAGKLGSAPVYRHVLCAYDASPSARAALEHAIDLAVAMRARLAIVTVVERPPAGVAAAGVDPEALSATIETERNDELREACALVPDEVPVTTMLRSGHAGREILRAADEVGADLIVLGTRGRGRVTSSLFGSVAADVHFHTRLPMLVVAAPAPG
jgi:nucleotide-binding universal stress UspA family protein